MSHDWIARSLIAQSYDKLPVANTETLSWSKLLETLLLQTPGLSLRIVMRLGTQPVLLALPHL